MNMQSWTEANDVTETTSNDITPEKEAVKPQDLETGKEAGGRKSPEPVKDPIVITW